MKTTTLYVRNFPIEVNNKLKKLAIDRGVTKEKLVTSILQEAVEEKRVIIGIDEGLIDVVYSNIEGLSVEKLDHDYERDGFDCEEDKLYYEEIKAEAEALPYKY